MDDQDLAEANTQLALRWFDLLSELRFADAWALDHRDGFLWVPKLRVKLPLPEWEASYERLMDRHFPNGGVQYTNGITVAQGNRVCVLNESRGTLQNGEIYNNHYSWVFEADGTSILGIYEYMDTLYAENTLHAAGWPGPRG